jgi:membrane protein DedA with SNARE-associated domain
METVGNAILETVGTYAILVPPVVFVLAFGESFAFISLLLPATVLLAGGSGIVTAAGVDFWVIWIAAATGAVLGDWVSYWLGFHYKAAIGKVWPFSRHPALLTKGQTFFADWGAAGVFLGRFFGPLRCVVPLAAGICAMPLIPFQIANLASAVLWATVVLLPGRVAVGWLLI